tara:strand:- start:1247 stop:1393 length:147 start_codon:yes stop_codon:yes gene_type:complete
MKLTDKQFLNLLEDLVKEATTGKEVLLETPGKKKTIREKMREKKSGKT